MKLKQITISISASTVFALVGVAHAGQAPNEPPQETLEVSTKGPFSMRPAALLAADIAMGRTESETLDRAVWTQDRELTEKLLGAGADPNGISTGNQEPFLVVAAMQGDPQIILTLLSHGANINAVGGTGDALYWAARQGNLDAVKTLIQGGANVRFSDSDGSTALHMTLGDDNDIRVAEALLDAGADIEAQRNEMTPLMTAALFGRTEWVRLLIQRGANVNATTTSGRTALSLSHAFGSNHEIETLLKAAGAK